ncbi:hypothetical protein BDW22DRAFT_1258585 [Trametopsis cervina]|nr:hypothetical protein BDW22DRAFT_1258585 [Trametopsis cervina]
MTESVNEIEKFCLCLRCVALRCVWDERHSGSTRSAAALAVLLESERASEVGSEGRGGGGGGRGERDGVRGRGVVRSLSGLGETLTGRRDRASEVLWVRLTSVTRVCLCGHTVADTRVGPLLGPPVVQNPKHSRC